MATGNRYPTGAVYPYLLQRERLEAARTNAFAMPVYAGILRSLGCRCDTKPLWLMGLLGNLKLLGVAVTAIVFQPWTPHNAALGAFLKSTIISWLECFVLMAVGAILMLTIEAIKAVRFYRIGVSSYVRLQTEWQGDGE